MPPSEEMQLAGPQSGRQERRPPAPRRGSDALKQGPWRCANCPKEFSQSQYPWGASVPTPVPTPTSRQLLFPVWRWQGRCGRCTTLGQLN